MKHILFKIITPEKIVFNGEIYSAILPVEEGEVTILPDHIPYIASVRPGGVVIKKGDPKDDIELSVSGGFLEFHDNILTLLADTAERAEDIDLERAERARVRAEEIMKQKHKTDDDYARTVAMLDKELMRVRVARKHHARRKQSFSTE